MIRKQLVSPRQLHSLVKAGFCVVVDCRFSLDDPEKGRSEWAEAHIPGAHYAHLDEDLASAITSTSGRHPLPDPNVFGQYLASIGWTPNKTLVAYDDASNAIAARLWWLMRYFNQKASLLDGGLAAWNRAGLPLEIGPGAKFSPSPVQLTGQWEMTVSTEELTRDVKSGRLKVIDARAPERFSGKVEPLDSKGGHIPGAFNRPFQQNLDENSCFKDTPTLQKEFNALLDGRSSSQVAHSCGSGVTACHNYFAMELAGFDPGVLYPGSWSEWIRDPERPVETGSGQ